MKTYLYILLCFFIIPFSVNAQNTISVLYFENTTDNSAYQWLSKGLADMLISDLTDLPKIKMIERASLEKVLKEQALGLTGLLDEASTVEVGRLLQANQLICGAYILNDNFIRIDIKLVSVESGTILHAFDVKGDIHDIFKLETEMVTNLRKKLNIAKPLAFKTPETKSVDALARYYTALDHLDNKRYAQAENEFIKATELDPLFYRAQEGLAQAYRFLKAFRKYRQQREIAQLYAKINKLWKRIEAPKFITLEDIWKSPQYQSLTPEQQQIWNANHNEYSIGNTPAHCTWEILTTMEEIADKSAEYFGDTDLQKKMRRQIIEIGEKSRNVYAGDPFLPEILYYQLLACYLLKDYSQLKDKSEEFLMTYPDYRLIEIVEDWYEKALTQSKNPINLIFRLFEK